MPPVSETLKQAFREKTYLITAHGSARAAKRKIRSNEIEQAVSSGEVIEDYPNEVAFQLVGKLHLTFKTSGYTRVSVR